MGCGIWDRQLGELNKALSTMRSFGIPVNMPAFRQIQISRNSLLAKAGFQLPRIIQLLVRFVGFSPGVIALFHDNENGFIAEARATPSSEPVRHMVRGETAMLILTHDISPELELFLMTPDEDPDN